MTCEQIRGAKETIERQMKARQIKNEQKKFWEKYRDKFENVNFKTKKPTMHQSFSFENRNIQHDDPILYVDVEYKKGKFGKLAIHRGESVKEIADKFTNIYHLNDNERRMLEK